MGAIDEIDRMQKSGLSEDQMLSSLQSKGFTKNEVLEAMNQTKIKTAIQEPFSQDSDLQPSMLGHDEQAQEQEQQQNAPAPGMQTYQPEQSYPSYDAQQNTQQQYPGYQDYSQQSISSDTISEISEQIVSEKFSTIKDQLERIIDFRNSVETKMQIMDDRLKQIEKIIDRLQVSVLQKVGDYVQNVDDIKKEVIETHKSIKAIAQGRHAAK